MNVNYEAIAEAIEDVRAQLDRLEATLPKPNVTRVHMEFPKAFMKISELKKMGLPEQMLLEIYRCEKGVGAKSGKTENCPIIFDTARLSKVLEARFNTKKVNM